MSFATDDAPGAIGARVLHSCTNRLIDAMASLDIQIEDRRRDSAKDRFENCVEQIIEQMQKLPDGEIERRAQQESTLRDVTPRQMQSAMEEALSDIRERGHPRVVIRTWDFLIIVMRKLVPLTIVQRRVTDNNFYFMERYIDDILESDHAVSRFGNGRHRDTAKLAVYLEDPELVD